MPAVPYTTTYTAADREYLGDRLSKSPAICQVLQLGKLMNDTRQIAEKLDLDAGVSDTGPVTGYVATTIDE